MIKQIKIITCLLSALAVLSACNKESEPYSFQEVENDKFEHLHGVGYINGGPEFVIATHDGLYQYGEQGWKEANSEKHDYMGFQAVRDGFFSSGHPESGSDLKNPLGLIKSTDHGATFDKLAFYGEIDFHYLGAGYETNAVYVMNEMPTDDLPAGFQYTLDEGETWMNASLNGYDADSISNLAVHPSEPGTIAIGSEKGVYISEDHGNHFVKLIDQPMVIYVVLTEDGGYNASYEKENVELTAFSSEDGQETVLPLPDENMDPIVFLAVSPDNTEEIVIVTNDNSIYLTKDRGQNWEMLSQSGKLSM